MVDKVELLGRQAIQAGFLRRFGDGTLEAALIILKEEDKLENDNYQSKRRPNSNPSWRSHEFLRNN
jgi:hypothetical protein